MKKIMVSIAMLAFLLMSAPTWAQSSPTDKLFDEYGSQDGFTTVHISKELFSLFAEISQESDDAEVAEINKVVNGLEHVRILMCDVSDSTDRTVFNKFKNELNGVKLNNFTELMTVKEDNEIVKFMILKDGKNIKELLLLINQPDEAGFISIKGNIDLKSIGKLSKSMNIDGLENLQKLNDK